MSGAAEGGWGNQRHSYEMTMRTKQQSRRSKINYELNKEILLKGGAERLLRTNIDAKAKKKAEMELSFYQCKIKMLREELHELNSAILIYQTAGNATTRIPLLPIPLKESVKAKYDKVVKPYLIDHYHVNDLDDFSQPLEEINRMREMTQQPGRDKAGLELLYEYCNQLHFLDKRFYPTQGFAGQVYFQWFDLWVGTAAAQQSTAFEKANVMFNIAALYSQLAIEQNRSTKDGLEEAVHLFEQAAGVLMLLGQAFVNAPSLDISKPSVDFLYSLMIAQAHECSWEVMMVTEQEGDIELAINIAKETAYVAQCYKGVCDCLESSEYLSEMMTPFWKTMISLKRTHFQALSFFYAGIACVDFLDDDELTMAELLEQGEMLTGMFESLEKQLSSKECQRYAGHLCFESAVKLHQESKKLTEDDKLLKKLAAVRKILEMDLNHAKTKIGELKGIKRVHGLTEVTPIKGERVLGREIKPVKPEFSKYIVVDFFRRLGPLPVFNASTKFNPPREITLNRAEATEGGLGFIIRGNGPVKILHVDEDSPANKAGLLRGDIIVMVNGEAAREMTHDEVVAGIRSRDDIIQLTVMTPTDPDLVLQAPSPRMMRSVSMTSQRPPTDFSLSREDSKRGLIIGGSSSSDVSSGSNRSSLLGVVVEEKENSDVGSDQRGNAVQADS
ncbi:rhophilin-2-like [Oscarella lobularis]|uniref:rhophilin-2-like n=1 Tax=Oscarella lobularis TaxID=121494 RepID=UPI00331353FB